MHPTKSSKAGVKAKRSREHILNTALSLFQKRGFDKTTMRAIASECNIALGASYYHFSCKEELVLAFYERSLNEFEQRAKIIFSETADFEKRLLRLVASKLVELKPYKKFLFALTRSALDPRSPISPFTGTTGDIRQRVISIFKECVESSDLKVPKALRQRLALLLWIYHMALIFLWLHDETPGEAKTSRITERSAKLVFGLLKLANLPFTGAILKPVYEMIDEFLPDGSAA